LNLVRSLNQVREFRTASVRSEPGFASFNAFLSWAGLRGAVPIVLATFALPAEVSGSATIVNAVSFVVLVSTLAQGMTLEPFARRLGLVTEE
jgi:NhaP-type Na+/H+ and K+/H+ antiporter